jgi:flagellar biosynthetic protein FliR
MTDLIGALTGLAQEGQAHIWAGTVVFLRVGAAAALIPGFGEQFLPARIRLGAALALTAVVAPAVAPSLPEPEIGLPRVLLSEPIAGLALGLALRLFILALQMAGTMIAQSTSLAQLFGGAQMDPQPTIGYVLTLAGLALAMSLDLHVRAAQYLILSYDLFRPGVPPSVSDMTTWGVERIGQAFALAFRLAAPFVIAGFLYNLALGLINRSMPQLMVAFVGAPALALGSLALLALLGPLLLGVWLSALSEFLLLPFGSG